MVGVAQAVEHQVVALVVAGSNPVTHPTFILHYTFERCSILFKFKKDEDFNHRHTFEYFED